MLDARGPAAEISGRRASGDATWEPELDRPAETIAGHVAYQRPKGLPDFADLTAECVALLADTE